MNETLKISVLGAGSWGTALAVLLNENGHWVRLWEFDEEQAELVRSSRVNEKFLPGIEIPEAIEITSDLSGALSGAQLMVFVVPTHTLRGVARSVAGVFRFTEQTLVVNASKGLEMKTLKRMSEVLEEELGVSSAQVYSVLGPSHAEEVSRKMPTSVVVAGLDVERATRVQHAFSNPYFRVYTSSDVVGVEIGVALKNCIAIAAGICDGLGYGDNTKAALITRGLAEIGRLGAAMGADPLTFAGLTGIGDLVVTCLSRHSRNRFVGEKVGRGHSLETILGEMVMVAEGVRTTRAAVELGRKTGVELPIIESVNEVLFSGKNPRDAIMELMDRPLKDEMN